MARWRPPTYDEEAAEFERTAEELDIPLGILQEAMRKGELVDLSGYIWCTLDNADVAFSLAEAEKIAATHGRDVWRIARGILARDTLPAPIILNREGRRPYLIAGNTRLMVCRGLDAKPKVWMIRVNGT